MFLHETHLQDKDNIKLKRGWVRQVFATSYSSFIRGIAILVSKKLAFQCLNCVKNDHGRYIIVKGTLLGKEVTFMNLYCPPGYSPSFLASSFATFAGLASADMGGDFNCHIDPVLDKWPSSSSPPSSQARMLPLLCSDYSFCDVWRQRHPTDLGFTFFSLP